jgi:hypothetical protein
MGEYGHCGFRFHPCGCLVRITPAVPSLIGNPTNMSVRYTGISMILVAIVCGLGVWPASFVVAGETSSLHLRAKAQGIGWFTAGAAASLFGFVLPYIFNPDQGNLRAKTGFVFAGLSLVGAIVSFFHIPEMKNRTPAEIDEMFELRLPARHFKRWSGDQLPPATPSTQELQGTKEREQ